MSGFGSSALGDVVKMHDGRVFQGKVLEESFERLIIDAMVAGIRVQIGLSRIDIENIEKGPLPMDFFKTEAKPDKRISDPKKFSAGTTLYLQVPIVGRFGVQVVPSGVKKCLSYAAANRIKHVLFFIDSQGGDQVAVKEIYETLAKYSDRISYYAVVRDSVGGAMAVTVWCDRVLLLPGANLGGITLILDKNSYDGDPGVLRSQIAHDASVEAEKHGWPAPLVRAMIDPAETVVAWIDEQHGGVMTAVRPPSSVPRQKIIASSGPDSVLTLTRSQATRLGIANSFNGTEAQIGMELELNKWTRESDYGQTAMTRAAGVERRDRERLASRHEARIKSVVKRTQATRTYIERNLAMANNWDSNLPIYSTYRKYSNNWERYWGGSRRQTLTGTRWRELTDRTTRYLLAARKGVLEMKKLDAESKRLGIKPSYPDGELDQIQQDIEVKVTRLRFWRDRRTSAA